MGYMDADASRALGAPQVAGTWVNPKGWAKKVTASVAGREIGGAVGSVAGTVMAGRNSRPSVETPNFGKIGFLAVSETEVALIKGKQGMMKPKVTDEVLARNPRSDVASAELAKGKLASELTITFSNGDTWQFDIPRIGLNAAGEIVRSLSS